MPEQCPQEIAELIIDCRNSNPANRPTAKQVFNRIKISAESNLHVALHRMHVEDTLVT